MDTSIKTFTPREEALLSAAVRVTAASGMRGLTHRAVDREAGLPEGTSSAYMRTRLALLTGLAEYVSTQFAADIQGLATDLEGHPEDPEYAVQQSAQVLLSWLEDPDLLLARFELNLERLRQPELDALSHAWWSRLVAIVQHAMEAVDEEHRSGNGSAEKAETLIAAVDGVLMHALREPPEVRTPFVRRSLERLIGGMAERPAG